MDKEDVIYMYLYTHIMKYYSAINMDRAWVYYAQWSKSPRVGHDWSDLAAVAAALIELIELSAMLEMFILYCPK